MQVKLLEYKLGCADLEVTSWSQGAPGGGLLLVLVACKIIYYAFVEGKTITGSRSSASIGCVSLSIWDCLASRSRRVNLGLCLRSHITHIYRIRLFKTNYAFPYSKLVSSNECQQVRKSRNGGWRKEKQPLKQGLVHSFPSELCALTAKCRDFLLSPLCYESSIVVSTGTDELIEYLSWFLDKVLQPGQTLA